MTRTIISGGTLVSPQGTLRADLLIEGEQVVGIVAAAQPGPGDSVIDASGLLVLPGVVDAHTHIQLDTGIYQTADNWEIGTKAAAAGGVTTVIDFANQIKGRPFKDALDARCAEAAPAIIDYAFHMVILEPAGDDAQLARDLASLLDLGVTSLKLFTTYRPNYYLDDARLLRIFRALPEGMIAMVHCENDAIVSEATGRLVAEGHTGWRYHAKARPQVAEVEAVNRITFLADQAGVPVYIAHCTNDDTLAVVEEARLRGQPVYCETCPQYLLLDDGVYDGPHPERYILQPPLRERENLDLLWQRVSPDFGAVVDVISTDTCDYTIQQKTEHNTFTETPGGLPGIETLLPLVYTYGVCAEYAELGFDLPHMVRMLCANPAKLFGLYPRKGALQVGSDADVVLYDPALEKTIQHKNLHYLAGYSPYDGMHVQGEVVMTLARGEIVYNRGVFPAGVGRGQFVPGGPFAPESMER